MPETLVIVAARECAERLRDHGQRAARGEPPLVIGDPQLGDPALEGLPLAEEEEELEEEYEDEDEESS